MLTAPLSPIRDPPLGDCSATVKVSSISGILSLLIDSDRVCSVAFGPKVSVVRLKENNHYCYSRSLTLLHCSKVFSGRSCVVYSCHNNSNGVKRWGRSSNSERQADAVLLNINTRLSVKQDHSVSYSELAS